MELRIRDSKTPTGDTRILLINHDEVVHQLRAELTESAKAKAALEGRAQSLAETRKIERAVKAVPQEIVISERKLNRLASDLELESLIVDKFYPVLRPQAVHVVQAHMAGGSALEDSVARGVRDLVLRDRASGLDTDAIRAHVTSVFARLPSDLDEEMRSRTIRAVSRAVEDALSEDPDESASKQMRVYVRTAREMIAPMAREARKAGLTKEQFTEALKKFLSEMGAPEVRGGVSPHRLGDIEIAYHQAAAEALASYTAPKLREPSPRRATKRAEPQKRQSDKEALLALSEKKRAALETLIQEMRTGLPPHPRDGLLLLASAIIELDKAARARLRQQPNKRPGKKRPGV